MNGSMDAMKFWIMGLIDSKGYGVGTPIGKSSSKDALIYRNTRVAQALGNIFLEQLKNFFYCFQL